jgi:dihydroflavonol-4-reductase
MKGCHYVIHVASPFVLREPKDESDLIVPAVEGTRRVVSAAKRAGVKRLVLTSTTLAIAAGKETGRYGADSWSDTAAPIGAYAKSKTLAERAAWELVTDSSMELVAINPGVVFGPPLDDESDGQTVTMIANMIGGKMPMIPNVAMGMVDVRDVARLHVTALTAPRAPGQRFIASTSEPIAMADVAAILKQAGYAKVPSRRAPNVAVRLMSLFDRQAKGMLPLLGKRIAFDTTATSDVLDWQPTPMEASFKEMAESLSE